MRVTTLVDGEIVSLYDEIMLKDPMLRTAAEERFIEHVGERLFFEVADEKDLIERDERCHHEVFVNEEGIVPTCDLCGGPQRVEGDDWNGETGNHHSCEQRQPEVSA
jgi:hypothetical protein